MNEWVREGRGRKKNLFLSSLFSLKDESLASGKTILSLSAAAAQGRLSADHRDKLKKTSFCHHAQRKKRKREKERSPGRGRGRERNPPPPKKKLLKRELRLPRKLDRPQQRSTARRKAGTLSVRALRMVFDDSVMKNRETGPTWVLSIIALFCFFVFFGFFGFFSFSLSLPPSLKREDQGKASDSGLLISIRRAPCVKP